MSVGLTTVVKQVAAWLQAELDRTARKKQEDWIVECLADASKVSTAVAVSLLSIALGRDPLDDEVQELLRDTINSPAAPARVRRLLEELFRSPSPRRRARLAAVFVGGPRLVDTPDQRDRLDILAASLLEEDVETLSALYRLWQRYPGTAGKAGDLVFLDASRGGGYSQTRWPVRCLSILDGADAGSFDWSTWPVPSRASVRSLEAAGCLSIVEQHLTTGDGSDIYLEFKVTELGVFAAQGLLHEAIQSCVTSIPSETTP